MSDDSERARLRYIAFGSEQMGESFWVRDVRPGPRPGTRIGVVSNVLLSEVLGYGDEVLLGENDYVLEVLTRAADSTYLVAPTASVADNPAAESAWAIIRNALADAAHDAGVRGEGWSQPPLLLLQGSEADVVSVLSAVLNSPDMISALNALPIPAEESTPITWAISYDATISTGARGPELDGWELISEPHEDIDDTPDPDFEWDPMLDEQAVTYVREHTLAVLPDEQWFALARSNAYRSRQVQGFIRKGESWRVMMMTANMELMRAGLPLLRSDQ